MRNIRLFSSDLRTGPMPKQALGADSFLAAVDSKAWDPLSPSDKDCSLCLFRSM